MKFEYKIYAEFFKVLAHPVRLKIVQGLVNNECYAGKMISELKLPQSTVSQHLNILKRFGVIGVRKEGVRSCYRIVHPKLNEIIKILEHNESLPGKEKKESL